MSAEAAAASASEASEVAASWHCSKASINAPRTTCVPDGEVVKKYIYISIYLSIYLSIHLTICERSPSFAGDHLEVSAKRMEIRKKKHTWLYYGFNIEIVWFGGTSILRNLHFESYTSLPPANDRFLRYASRFEPPIHKL
jgi:hypothetical protein